ncbi:MAG: plasmid pRiA4b ORF-3 family protein [Ruminococcus bromii]|nr:plasmid pRiA4b ORF-3 family protein [Ruminococcus bromii]MBD9012888.1 plasmid pRiA4b ORF-3 family protein [Ruminococcus bromii]
MARVYTFKIVYIGCENKILRDIQISSNSTMAVLGYAVLSSFSTCAYHLFMMTYKGTDYELDDEEIQTTPKLMSETKLGNLKLEIGDKIHMIYDFGEEQEFEITLLSDEEMPKGSGRAYPKVSDGAGRGIIDDMSAKDLLDLIKKIDKTGKSDFIYAHRGERAPWDYRNYQIDIDNCLLKGRIAKIKSAYENPEEDF